MANENAKGDGYTAKIGLWANLVVDGPEVAIPAPPGGWPDEVMDDTAQEPADGWPTEHEPDCAINGRAEGLDNRTMLEECTCQMGNL